MVRAVILESYSIMTYQEVTTIIENADTPVIARRPSWHPGSMVAWIGDSFWRADEHSDEEFELTEEDKAATDWEVAA